MNPFKSVQICSLSRTGQHDAVIFGMLACLGLGSFIMGFCIFCKKKSGKFKVRNSARFGVKFKGGRQKNGLTPVCITEIQRRGHHTGSDIDGVSHPEGAECAGIFGTVCRHPVEPEQRT